MSDTTRNLMTEQHPITPPPELIRKWNIEAATAPMSDQRYIAIQAARWGADQELEACCEWLRSKDILEPAIEALRAARRPKPPSLAENVSKALDRLPGPGADASYLRIWADKEAYGLRCAVRRALERLQELENRQ